MAIGPHDKRLTRQRCLSCAARHLKCPKGLPCANCQSRSLLCQYPSPGAAAVEVREELTIFAPTRIGSTTPAFALPSTGEARSHNAFFHIFIPQNRLSAGAAGWHEYLSSKLPQCRGHASAIASLGGLVLHMRARQKRCHAHVLREALDSYQTGVQFLQQKLQKHRAQWDPLSLLSVAFLLSMFELMYDTTGKAWNAHMGFGTAAILDACGPSLFCSPQAIAIYREFRLFEISRAALFSQNTVLLDAGWLQYQQTLRAKMDDWGLLELAFDLFLQCVMLCQRAIEYVEPRVLRNRNTGSSLPELARAGLCVQSQLATFADTLAIHPEAAEIVMARIYYHALSIYLSGIFDHVLCHSECEEDVLRPSLPAQQIDIHLTNIICLSEVAMESCQMSITFLLLPLRIAGNRSSTSQQCLAVLYLICRIEGSFSVAAAFKAELKEIWSHRYSKDWVANLTERQSIQRSDIRVENSILSSASLAYK